MRDTLVCCTGSRKRGQETRRGHKGTSGALVMFVTFLDLGAGNTYVFTCESLSSCTNISTLWYTFYNSIKIYIKKERKTCNDSHPWPLTYHSTPSKSRLIRHTLTSSCLSQQLLSPRHFSHPSISDHNIPWMRTSSCPAPTGRSKSTSNVIFLYKAFPDPSVHCCPHQTGVCLVTGAPSTVPCDSLVVHFYLQLEQYSFISPSSSIVSTWGQKPGIIPLWRSPYCSFQSRAIQSLFWNYNKSKTTVTSTLINHKSQKLNKKYLVGLNIFWQNIFKKQVIVKRVLKLQNPSSQV